MLKYSRHTRLKTVKISSGVLMTQKEWNHGSQPFVSEQTKGLIYFRRGLYVCSDTAGGPGCI